MIGLGRLVFGRDFVACPGGAGTTGDVEGKAVLPVDFKDIFVEFFFPSLLYRNWNASENDIFFPLRIGFQERFSFTTELILRKNS